MKRFLQIQLKNGEYVIYELEDVESIFVTEINYYYKEKELEK